MIMMKGYSVDYNLRTSDFDRYDRLRPSAVLDLFQDVAGRNSDAYGSGFEAMLSKGLLWILLRTRYDVIKSPKPLSTVRAITAPHAPGMADFDRDYLITDLYGDVLIKGTSKWCLIDLNTRRIAFKYDEVSCGEYASEPLYPEGLKKIPNFSEEGFNEYKNAPTFSALDHNGHVNNIKYADFISDALALEKGKEIKTFEIDYIHEIKGGEFSLFYKAEDGGYLLKCVSGGEEIFRAKIEI